MDKSLEIYFDDPALSDQLFHHPKTMIKKLGRSFKTKGKYPIETQLYTTDIENRQKIVKKLY